MEEWNIKNDRIGFESEMTLNTLTRPSGWRNSRRVRDKMCTMKIDKYWLSSYISRVSALRGKGVLWKMIHS